MQCSWLGFSGGRFLLQERPERYRFYKTPTPRDITNVTMFTNVQTAPFNVGAAGEGSICSSVLALNIEGCVFPPK